MNSKITSSQFSVIAAIILIIGGISLFLMGYQNIFTSASIIGALVCLWFSQNPPRQKLFTIGLFASIAGILFSASINLFPIFRELRNTNPTIQPTNLAWYFSGTTLFCGMILVLMLGFIFLGISVIQSSSLPKASGVFFIGGGIIAIEAHIAGIMLALSGLSWFLAIYRYKRQAKMLAHLESLSED